MAGVNADRKALIERGRSGMEQEEPEQCPQEGRWGGKR